MRLAYFHNLSYGDTALHHVRQFTAAALASGVHIDVCPLEATSKAATDGKSAIQAAQTTLKRLLSFYLHEPKKVLVNLPSYRRAVRTLHQIQPDVVLVRNELLTFDAILAGRRMGLPVVLEVNSPAAESRRYLDQYLHLPILPEAMERWQLSKADRVTVVSRALREHLVSQYHIRSGKFSVIPNGADLAIFRPDSSGDADIEKALGLAPTVGFIGSFEKWHGVDLLREMTLRVAAERPQVRFVFVGDGPGRNALEQSLRPLSDRVLFTGRVPHQRIPGITVLLDVAVMPESNFYGSPLKVIEWMAAGRAIVAPDYGPLCEIIDSGNEGLLFKKRSVDDLVTSVVKLVDDPILRARLGEAAHRRAVESLSWTHNAEKVIGACKQAIKEH